MVLITQRIDEAELICDTIAMMDEGRFEDVGTPNYLKDKYGHGYILSIDLKSTKLKKQV